MIRSLFVRRGRDVLSGLLSAFICAAVLFSTQHPVVAQRPERSDEPVAIVRGTRVTLAELDAALGNRLLENYSQIYILKREALDQLIENLVLRQEADSRHVSVEALLDTEVAAKVKPVSDEEVRAVFDSAADRFAGRSQEEALIQIGNAMSQQRVRQRRVEFVKDLKSHAGVEILMPAPRIEVHALAGPSWGPADAPVTIIEFSDFQCPFCSRTVGTIRQIRAKYKDKVRFEFRDFPLPIHPDAPKAAEAARCGAEQEKFWEMHDKLFVNQQRLRPADLSRYAQELRLDIGAFTECLESGKYKAVVQRDKAEGERVGVTGTPTFFINGRFLVGNVPFDVFSDIIEEELKNRTAGAAGASTPPKTR
jgi:protein-disulfide isomerase